MTPKFKAFFLTLAASFLPAAFAQQHDPAPLMRAQREAMEAIRPMDGAWRGPAWTLQPDGKKRHLMQTERIGPFLGETVKVIEGRGYEEDGSIGFNAFGIISFDPATKKYSVRSYALGRHGDFPFTPTPDGYAWEVPAGPNAVIKYRGTIKGDTLVEIGHFHAADRPPVQVFEMNLKRLGNSDWPAGQAIPQR